MLNAGGYKVKGKLELYSYMRRIVERPIYGVSPLASTENGPKEDGPEGRCLHARVGQSWTDDRRVNIPRTCSNIHHSNFTSIQWIIKYTFLE